MREPYARFWIGRIDDTQADALGALPGIKVRRGELQVPGNAIDVTASLCDALQVPVHRVAWIVPPPPAMTWSDVCAVLRDGGEFKPHFLDEYALPHQRDGIAWACSRRGSLLHHPTGCLAGDARVSVHDGTTWTDMRMDDVAARWRPGADWLVRSADRHRPRVGRIERVYANGRQPLFRLSARTRSRRYVIDATASHRFLTLDGWRPLRRIHYGDRVYVVQDDRVVFATVQAITPAGHAPTYDMTVSDADHAYVANGLVVHNSGKTYEAIAVACAQPRPIPAVVVTRTQTVVQFTRQVAKYTRIAAFPLKSESNRRKRDRWQTLDEYLEWCDRHDQRPFVVMGYDNLTRFEPIVARLPTPTLVVDESHKLKSWTRWNTSTLPHPGPPPEDPAEQERWEAQLQAYKAAVRKKPPGSFVRVNERTGEHVLIEPANNRTAAALRIAKRAHRVVLTTATPIKDRVRDLYAQLTLCEPWSWGSWTAWSERYTDARPHAYNARARDTTGMSNADELVRRIRHVIHTVPAAEVRKHLPGLRRETLYVTRDQMTPLTERERRRFDRETRAAMSRGKAAVAEVRIAAAAAMCRKAILDVIETHVDGGHKVVVFTTRKWVAKALRGHVSGRVRKRARIWVGTGDDSQADRLAMFDEFQGHDGAGVFIGTGEAWGTSQDGFQVAQAAIFLGFPFAPGDLDQWEGRFPRLGQSEPIVIYYVVGEGTILEHYAGIVIDKLPAVEKIADTGALRGVAAALGGTMDTEALAASLLVKAREYDDTDADDLPD